MAAMIIRKADWIAKNPATTAEVRSLYESKSVQLELKKLKQIVKSESWTEYAQCNITIPLHKGTLHRQLFPIQQAELCNWRRFDFEKFPNQEGCG